MGITDKVGGRIKKAAGDLLDNKALHRQGREQEEKAEAQERLAREREELERRQTATETQRERVEQRAKEVSGRREETETEFLAEEHTRDELLEEARRLDIGGRSEMTKEELAAAVRDAR